MNVAEKSVTICSLIVFAFIFTIISGIVYATEANVSPEEANLPSFISEALSNPKVLIAVLIQFLLGLGLGYFSAKVVKYILALVGILILGSILSVWSLGGSIEDYLSRFGSEAAGLWPVVQGFLQTLGILTIGPVTAGFILGVILAFMKK